LDTVILNPKIREFVENECKTDSSLPDGLSDLVKKLLEIENISKGSDAGIDRLYTQILDKFITNDDLMQWSKRHAR